MWESIFHGVLMFLLIFGEEILIAPLLTFLMKSASLTLWKMWYLPLGNGLAVYIEAHFERFGLPKVCTLRCYTNPLSSNTKPLSGPFHVTLMWLWEKVKLTWQGSIWCLMVVNSKAFCFYIFLTSTKQQQVQWLICKYCKISNSSLYLPPSNREVLK